MQELDDSLQQAGVNLLQKRRVRACAAQWCAHPGRAVHHAVHTRMSFSHDSVGTPLFREIHAQGEPSQGLGWCTAG
jgi:hypothetical protein